MIDVGLPRRRICRRQPQPLEARIAQIACVGGRHRVAAEPEEAERAALEAVRRLRAAAAEFHEIVAVAGALEQLELGLDGTAGERIAPAVVKRDELRLARLGDRKRGDEVGQRLGVGEAAGECVGTPHRRLAGHQHVTPERLAGEEHAARQPERGVERALEGGLEPLDLDTELAQQRLGHVAVVSVRGIDQLAAAVADQQPTIEGELVAPGVTAEIVVVVEDEDARGRPGGAAVEPGGRQPADAAADDDEVVALLDRQPVDGKPAAVARLRVSGLE